ncbi:permease-like cell division protein FtsX [Candidatus Sororendozoicomonas aggregata]|uniref:permease-like cell division protein FtsX n=1 Tax=Candidatus Sororendozoicomonas aggregata TaxID=3073239 RepID=UPI002ED320FB
MSLFPEKRGRNKKKKPSTSKEARSHQESGRGAKKQVPGVMSPGYLVSLHRYMLMESVRRLWETPVSSFMGSLMIAMAFVLPVLFYLSVTTIQQLGEGWSGHPKIALYLKRDIGQEQLGSIRAQLARKPSVRDVAYISPEEGMESFQKQAGVQGIVAELGENPLPGVLALTMADDLSYAELTVLADSFKRLKGVDQVRLDKKWVQRLLVITDLLEQMTVILALLLGLTIWLAISNTVGLSIEARKKEIKVVKLVGGTDGFIMLPFLYSGVIYGVMGAFLAMVIAWAVLLVIEPSVLALTGLYGSQYELQGPGFSLFFGLVLFGAVLGFLGAMTSCRKHLKHCEPC